MSPPARDIPTTHAAIKLLTTLTIYQPSTPFGSENMQKHRVDGRSLRDWDAFHDFFASEFRFPDYYGRNMNAWNDCMSDHCYSEGLVSLRIDNASEFKRMNEEAFNALVECSAFINWRATEDGADPLLVLSYYV